MLLRWLGVVEKCEGYLDEIKAVCGSFEDISNVGFLVSRFKPLSGAILNQYSMSKIMGLGEWRGRTQWPLAWVKSVEFIRVFGIFLTPDWAEIPDMNWGSQLRGGLLEFLTWWRRGLLCSKLLFFPKLCSGLR